MDWEAMHDKPASGVPDHGGEAAAIARAMVAIRRAQTRRALSRLSARRGVRARRDATLPNAIFELLDVVDAATVHGGALTVTEAAAALGVDQPRASRLTAQAMDADLLRRAADQADGRRSLLILTPSGRDALDRIQAFRQHVIAEATTDWSTEDRATLARLLTRFVDDFTAIADPKDAEER
jgi:DNA-binding MarR family transcriptional regulator